eukprot:947506-Pleurochrysis_carterae.AAC.1
MRLTRIAAICVLVGLNVRQHARFLLALAVALLHVRLGAHCLDQLRGVHRERAPHRAHLALADRGEADLRVEVAQPRWRAQCGQRTARARLRGDHGDGGALVAVCASQRPHGHLA